MAITSALLTSGESAADATSYQTASITPSANKLILLAVTSREAGSDPADTPTISGNGLTWVQVAGRDNTSDVNNALRTTVFRAMGAAPSAGVVTITFVATQRNCVWSVVEFGGVDTSGTNGSGAIVQSANNGANNAASLLVTLAAFSGLGNATFGAFGTIADATSLAVGTGFTQLHQERATGEVTRMLTEWRSDNDTSVDASISAGTTDWAAVAVEIKASPVTVHDVAGTIGAESDLTAGMALVQGMGGVVAGEGDLSAAMGLDAALAGTVAAEGDLTGSLSLVLTFGGTVAGEGDLTADLFILQQKYLSVPRLIVEIGFEAKPLDPLAGIVWTDVTAYVRSVAEIDRGRQHELGRFEAGTAKVVLDNRDRRFDPNHAGSPYFPNVKSMRRVRYRAIWDGQIYDLFVGYIDSWGPDYSRGVDAWSELECSDALAALNVFEKPIVPFREEIADLTPYLFWPLDEPTSPTAGDLSGNGRTGTYTGPVVRGIDRDAPVADDGAAIALGAGGAVIGGNVANFERTSPFSALFLVRKTGKEARAADLGSFLDDGSYRGWSVALGDTPTVTLMGSQGAAAPSLASSSANATGNTSAGVSIGLPTGTVAGDLLVAIVGAISQTGDITIVAPSGWTLIHQPSIKGDELAVYYKVASSGEPSTYTFTCTGDVLTTDGMTGKILRLTGVDLSDPIHASAVVTFGTVGQTSFAVPGVTTVVPNALIVYTLATFDGPGASFTWPAGVTEQWDFSTDPGNASSQSGATKVQASAGATGSQTVTSSVGQGAAHGVCLAFAPRRAVTVRCRQHIADGRWHLIGFTYSGSSLASGLKWYVDAVEVSGEVLEDALSNTMVSGSATFALRGRLGAVEVGPAAVFSSVLTTTQIAAVWDAAKTGWANQRSSERVTKVLDALGWPAADRDIRTGVATLAGLDEPIESALKHGQEVADSELGGFYVDASGKFIFDDRYTGIVSSPIVATFGDGAGEIPYATLGQSPHDLTDVWSIVGAHRKDGPVMEAEDATARQEYGLRRLDREGHWIDDNQPQSVANKLGDRYKTQKSRFRSVEPSRASSVWATLLAAKLNRERYRIRKRPKDAAGNPLGAVIEQEVLISHISWKIDRDRQRWEATLELIPADAPVTNYFTWGQSVWGGSHVWAY